MQFLCIVIKIKPFLSHHMVHTIGRSRIFLSGAPTPNAQSRCANVLFCNFVCQKLHDNERIWTQGGGAHVTGVPLDPPMLLTTWYTLSRSTAGHQQKLLISCEKLLSHYKVLRTVPTIIRFLSNCNIAMTLKHTHNS